MQKENRKKRSLLILPSFQIHFISLFIFAFIQNLLIIAVGHYYIFQETLTLAHTAGLPSDHIFYNFLNSLQNRFSAVLFIAFGICLLIILFGGIYISHRVAGPIVRFINELNRCTNENVKLKSINFRANDYFQELASSYNRYSSNVSDRK